MFFFVSDAVGNGIVTSLSRPGGNMTGLSVQQVELAGKRVELLREVFPGLRRTNRIRINTLALGARIPTMHGFREYVEVGGLTSYGPNLPDLFRRAAEFVDKILRGAKPGDIPVEQPTKFDLVINRTTAKALGLMIPESFLLRADEVIE